MLLLLARHGNTFEPGQPALWIGARTDLPLTARGREQAASLASGLAPIGPHIRRIIAGPLDRTRQHGAIAACRLGFKTLVEVDERLREIDYGTWEGKTTEEIHAAGGEAELKAWNEHAVWPTSPGWTPPEETIIGHVGELSRELAMTLGDDDAALLISSNGILKFFLKLVPGAFSDMAAKNALKVATGNCCALVSEAGSWRVAFWNRQPQHLSWD